jgi:DNA polymerase alpha subunit B
LSNPAQFKINEVVFAVNTADIMIHLSGDEVARNPVQTDRMGRLAKYLIEQRKYFTHLKTDQHSCLASFNSHQSSIGLPLLD